MRRSGVAARFQTRDLLVEFGDYTPQMLHVLEHAIAEGALNTGFLLFGLSVLAVDEKADEEVPVGLEFG